MIEDTLGNYLSVSVEGGDCYGVDGVCEGALEIAYRNWHRDGVNQILSLTLTCGDELTIAASRITEFALTTSAGRARQRAIQAERDRLARAEARERGWSEDDE